MENNFEKILLMFGFWRISVQKNRFPSLEGDIFGHFRLEKSLESFGLEKSFVNLKEPFRFFGTANFSFFSSKIGFYDIRDRVKAVYESHGYPSGYFWNCEFDEIFHNGVPPHIQNTSLFLSFQWVADSALVTGCHIHQILFFNISPFFYNFDGSI